MNSYDPGAYPPFAVTVDLAVLTIRDGAFCLLLVERGGEPYAGSWALPGGFVGIDEEAGSGARRELVEETGIALSSAHLEQLATYSDPGRDPRMRVVSVAYVALVPYPGEPEGGSDAADARWWALDDLDEVEFAFDHRVIVNDAVERVRGKIEYTDVALRLMRAEFTLGELRRTYEAIWGEAIEAANFRRKILAAESFVTEVPGALADTGARPARLYKAGSARLLHPPFRRSGVT